MWSAEHLLFAQLGAMGMGVLMICLVRLLSWRWRWLKQRLDYVEYQIVETMSFSILMIYGIWVWGLLAGSS